MSHSPQDSRRGWGEKEEEDFQVLEENNKQKMEENDPTTQ